MYNQPTILQYSQHNPSLSATVILYLTFLDEFQLLSVNLLENHIIMGDFNIPTNVKTSQSDTLKYLVNVSYLTLRNTYPTHEAGNTLDLIISQSNSKIIESHSQGTLFSYHYTILITINSQSHIHNHTAHTLRNLSENITPSPKINSPMN